MSTLSKQYNPFSSTLVSPSIASSGEVWCISPSNKYIYATTSGAAYAGYSGFTSGIPVFVRLDVTGVVTPGSVTNGTLVQFALTSNNNGTVVNVSNLSGHTQNITACSNSVFFVFCSLPFNSNYGLFQIIDGSTNTINYVLPTISGLLPYAVYANPTTNILYIPYIALASYSSRIVKQIVAINPLTFLTILQNSNILLILKYLTRCIM